MDIVFWFLFPYAMCVFFVLTLFCCCYTFIVLNRKWKIQPINIFSRTSTNQTNTIYYRFGCFFLSIFSHYKNSLIDFTLNHAILFYFHITQYDLAIFTSSSFFFVFARGTIFHFTEFPGLDFFLFSCIFKNIL